MVFDKKEYNRQRQREKYAEFKQRRIAFIKKKGNCCALCRKTKKIYNLAHKEYHITESDYARHAKSMSVRWKRLIEAENNPDRFNVLCSKCHIGLDSFQALIKEHPIEKLLELLN